MKEAHTGFPSISTLLTQRSYKPFESVNEFGIPSLHENYVIDSGDDMGIAMSNVLIKQANNYEYSSHDAFVFPTFLRMRINYSVPEEFTVRASCILGLTYHQPTGLFTSDFCQYNGSTKTR